MTSMVLIFCLFLFSYAVVSYAIGKGVGYKEYRGHLHSFMDVGSVWVFGEDGKLHYIGGNAVTCRDCKAFHEDETPNDKEHPHFCAMHGTDLAEPDGFCAWGERREDA